MLRKNLLTIILLTGAAVRIMYLSSIWDTFIVNVPIIDSEYYHTWAASLFSGRGGEEHIFFMSPLYPYILGILYFMLGALPKVALIFQIMAGVIIIYLVFLIGKKAFSWEVGILSAFLAALYRPFIFYEGVLLTAILILLLNALIIITLLKNERTFWLHILTGVLLGLSALARPNILMFIPMLLFLFLLIPSYRDPRKAVFIIIGIAIILVPTAYRNYRVGGEWVLTTAGAGMNFYAGNNPEAEGIYWEAPFLRSAEPQYENEDYRLMASQQQGQNLSVNEASRFWFDQGLKYITDKPLAYCQLLLKKLFLFFHNTEIPNNLSIYAALEFSTVLIWVPFTFALLAPLGLAGWIMYWRKSRLALLHMYGFSYLTATLFFFAASEYRLPILLVLIPFASAGIVEFVRNMSSAKWKAAGNFILLAVLFAIPVNMSTGFTDTLQSSRMDYFNLGSVLQKNRQFDGAASMYQRALIIDPDFIEGHRTLGDCYHALGLREEAIEEFTRAGIDPEPEMLLLDAEDLLLKAQYTAQMGDYSNALALFKEATSFHPDPPVFAFYNMAFLNLQIGDTLEALDNAQMAADIDPYDARVCYLRGWIHESLGAWNRALDLYLEALEYNSTLHEARAQAASVYLKIGDKSRAADLIEPLLGIELHNQELADKVITIAKDAGF